MREGIFMLLDMLAMPRAIMMAERALSGGALAYISGSELQSLLGPLVGFGKT